MSKHLAVAVMIAGALASFLLSIAGLLLGWMVAFEVPKLLLGNSSAAFVSGAVGAVFGVLAFICCGRACWLYCRRRLSQSRPSRKYTVTIYFSIAGAVSSGAIMLAGTLILGHTRPMWMEIDYTLPAALVGLLIGAILGVAEEFGGSP